jgi:hypothetical protein
MAERAPFRGQEAFPRLPDDTALIWWTCQQDCDLIRAMFLSASANWSEDEGLPTWPAYLADRYVGRYGRNGRGRLWGDDDFAEVSP